MTDPDLDDVAEWLLTYSVMSARPDGNFLAHLSWGLRMTNSPGDGVGYKSPPAHTRFRPGRSGNPNGRPKRRPSFRAALLAELAETVPSQDRHRAESKLRALVKTLVDSAIAGDARAQSLLVGALARIDDGEDNESVRCRRTTGKFSTRTWAESLNVAPTKPLRRHNRASAMRITDRTLAPRPGTPTRYADDGARRR